MANKLNMAIAKTHQLSTRTVGMQLTSGNFVGIALSAVQMVTGFIFLADKLINGRWYMYLFIGVIGCALAILVERLSLGGLIAIRVANERIENLEEAHYQMLQEENRQETPQERENLDRRVERMKKNKKASVPVAILGMLLSTVVGDIFWHKLFEPLGDWYIVFPMSLACAAVIGLTFVYSELYKAIMDGTLGDIISDDFLMRLTVSHEHKNLKMDMVVEAFDNIRKDKERKRPAQEKVENVLVEGLSEFANEIEANGSGVMVNEHSTNVRSLPGNDANVRAIPAEGETTASGADTSNIRRLPAPNGRGRYRSSRDELKRLREDNPRMSRQAMADHFGVSKSTIQAWIDRLEEEEEAEVIQPQKA